MLAVTQLVRASKGMFALCVDDTNGRIYFRRNGSRTWKRYTAPPGTAERLTLTVGKRGLFCRTNAGTYFRPFKAGGTWRKYATPSA